MLLTLGQSVPCIAANEGDVPRVTVKCSDLNLETAQGAATLLGRLRAAASVVCGPSYENTTTFRDLDMHRCEHQIVKNAVKNVGRPSLYAAYNARYHELLPNQPVVATGSLGAQRAVE
jgi:UrcA family protein